ncbi:unnamed protein product [Heterosigma akashiwo]
MQAHGVDFGPDGYPAESIQKKRALDLLNMIDQMTKATKKHGNSFKKPIQHESL